MPHLRTVHTNLNTHTHTAQYAELINSPCKMICYIEVMLVLLKIVCWTDIHTNQLKTAVLGVKHDRMMSEKHFFSISHDDFYGLFVYCCTYTDSTYICVLYNTLFKMLFLYTQINGTILLFFFCKKNNVCSVHPNQTEVALFLQKKEAFTVPYTITVKK